jgi:hypothetical protein
MAMREVCFSWLVFALGAVTLLPLRRDIPIWHVAVTAFPIGSVVWALMVLASAILGTSAMVWAVAGVYLLVTGAWACMSDTRYLMSREQVVWVGGIALFILLGSYSLTAMAVTLVSYDSIIQMMIGRTLVLDVWNLDVAPYLASWGAYLIAMQGSSVLIGVDYLSSFQGLLGLSLVGILISSLLAASLELRALPGTRMVTIGLGVALLISTYFVVFQAVYVHNNLPSAVLLLIATHALWQLAVNGQENWARLALLGLIGFTLCRTESPLFVAVLLCIALCDSDSGIARRAALSIVLPYTGFFAVWYTFLYITIGAGTDILSPGKVLVLAASILGTAGAVSLRDHHCLAPLIRRLPLAIVLAATTWVMLALLTRFDHTSQSMGTVLHNLAGKGHWGATWWTIGIALAMTAVLPRFPGQRFIVYFSIAFVALVLGLGSMLAYRLGWGDSANRMFTHLLPLLIFMLVLKLQTNPDAPQVVRQLRSLVVRISVVGGVLFGVVAFTWGYRSTDRAVGAIVTGAVGFCPADNGGEHDFGVALRGVVDEKYAAACSPGERQIVLDLKRPLRARFVEMVAYTAEERPTDFAYEISADGTTWQVLFDTDSTVKSLSMLEMLSPVAMRVPAHMVGEFRYLRFSYRKSLGQNRLLLRKLSVVASAGWSLI